MNSPTLPLTGGLGGPQPAEGEIKMAYHLTNKDNSPTETSWVTSGLEPAQLMAETLISRGMLYLASRDTDLLVVVRYCGVVLVCILYSSTTSSSPDSQESVMEKVSVW